MADIKGIELASDIYGLEDETARGDTETNASAIGNLANLNTTAKNNLVAAINEIKADTTPDVLVVNTLVGNGTVRLRKVGKIVYMNIADVRGLEESQDYLLCTLPEKFRPSETVRTIISLAGGSWSIQGFTGLNIFPSGNVQLYTYTSSSSEASANAAVTWIQA